MRLIDIPTKLLRPLWSSDTHSRVSFSPDDLDLLSVVIIICCFIIRTVKNATGLGTRFETLTGNAQGYGSDWRDQSQYFALPESSLSMPLQLDDTRIKAFERAIEPQSDIRIDFIPNNAQLCLYLAAVSEPAMLLLLAKKGCPVQPLGAVNVRNRFELLRPHLCRALIGRSNDLASVAVDKNKTSSAALALLARFPRPARRVRRGVEVDIEVTIMIDQTYSDSTRAASQPENLMPQTSVPIFRQQFTILQFMKFVETPSEIVIKQSVHANTPENAVQNDLDLSLTVQMTHSAPSAWAELCKDYNPIHFSSTIAKVLGQGGQLAHGNHAVGVCVQAMSKLINRPAEAHAIPTQNSEGLDAITDFVSQKTGSSDKGTTEWWMEVKFRRPIVLPATIGPRLHNNGDGFDIVNTKNGKVSIEVRFGSAQ